MGSLDRVTKLIYSVAGLVSAFLISVAPARAQSATATPFEILDNSFIVEEAFNQEAGIFQNIFGVRLDEGSDWEFGFTQEWPRRRPRRTSFRTPFLSPDSAASAGVGDVLINYRYQWWFGERGASRVFPAPQHHSPERKRRRGPRRRRRGMAGQPAVQQTAWRPLLSLERRLYLAAQRQFSAVLTARTSICSRRTSPRAPSGA